MNIETLIWVTVALAFGGLTKGLSGVGLPLVAVPVLAGAVGVELAVLIMVIPSVALNAYPAWLHRDAAGTVPELKRLLLAGIPGAALGAGILQFASDRLLGTVMAAWLIAYVLLRFAHPNFQLPLATRRRWSVGVGMAAGAMQASTGISAPIVAPYMDAARLQADAYVFAVCMCFGSFALAHLLIVTASGVYTAELLATSLLAILPAVGFIPVGVMARRLISRRAFDWIVRLSLVVMALRLLYNAWAPS
jgi:uncharacterized membrane protein YfcA